MTKYRIANHHEEGPCCYCGEPLFVGDIAYEHDGDIFCSKRCVENSEMDPRPVYYCEFCEETPVMQPGMLCIKCARMLGERADRADHLNRCDW
jgi:hypothetical protein